MGKQDTGSARNDQADITSGVPVGIDLGTTFSALAAIDDAGEPYCIENEEGELITPTAVLLDEREIVIGREAVNASALEPHSYADYFKRDIGAAVYRNGLKGVEVPPQVLNAFVLEKLKSDAELVLGEIQEAVITVPAFFDEGRRKATQDAGKLAGLRVLDIINEPTAAALAYGAQRGFMGSDTEGNKEPVCLLVYDLGGGTFDVTILEIKGRTCRAVATDGDVHLGGRDFDERIVEYLAETFIGEHGIDVRADPAEAAQLWINAAKAKHALSARSKTTIVVGHRGVRSKVELTRDKFESMTQDLLVRTETTTTIVLKAAAKTWDDIDHLLLVGGSSRMPAVSEMLRSLSGMEPDRSLSPDQAVAHGAAIHANNLSKNGKVGEGGNCELINVNSHSLGVKGFDRATQRHANAIMIPKNTELPCRKSKLFRTHSADQKTVRIVVLEGESVQPSECIEVGECVIRDMPSDLPAGSKVEVIYEYAADGRLGVSAKVQATRESAHVELNRVNSEDLGTLESWRQRLLVDDTTVSADCPGNVLRRLDELYLQIGKALIKAKLPSRLLQAQAVAKKAMDDLQSAENSCKKVEREKLQPTTHARLVEISVRHARAKNNFERAGANARFSCLVLGRQAYREKVAVVGAEHVMTEIGALREMLA